MPSMNLLQGGKGGGGLTGANKWVVFGDVKFVKHSFEKKNKQSGSVEEVYPPGVMLELPFEIEEPDDEDHRHVVQYYPVGNLPNTPGSLTGPGGYVPSIDPSLPDEGKADSGPFVVSEGVNNFGGPITDIWELSPFMQLMDEFNHLDLKSHQERIAAQGVAALSGTRCHLIAKVQRVSDKKAAKGGNPKTFLAPDQIDQWGWERNGGGSAKTATAAAGKGKAAPKPTAAASSPAPATTDGNASPAVLAVLAAQKNTTADPIKVAERATEVVTSAIAKAGGSVEHGKLKSYLMAETTKDGVLRPAIMGSANDKGFLAEGMELGNWLWDAETEMLTAL